eukprot:390757-Hanusia_phi.AAC.1
MDRRRRGYKKTVHEEEESMLTGNKSSPGNDGNDWQHVKGSIENGYLMRDEESIWAWQMMSFGGMFSGSWHMPKTCDQEVVKEEASVLHNRLRRLCRDLTFQCLQV